MRALLSVVLVFVALCAISFTKNMKDHTLRDSRGANSSDLRERMKKELTTGEYQLILLAGMRHAFASDTTFEDMKIKDDIAEQEKCNKEKGE